MNLNGAILSILSLHSRIDFPVKDFTLKSNMRQNRYMKFFIPIFLLISSFAMAEGYEDSVVLEEANFQKLAVKMQKNKMGLVMMLHAEHCPYCRLMDEEILSPMIRSGEYDKKVFIRKLQVDVSDGVIDFKGQKKTASKLASEYDSQLTPTLLFLDHSGKEKALKLIGINSIEFFGVSVDEQIEELLAEIRK